MKKILKFLSDIQGLVIKKEADNPFFKSKYMTLDSIMAVVNPLLKKAGLVLVHYGEGGGLVTAIVDPETGERLESSLKISLEDPQKVGACITYFRRYNTCALLNILSDEDDDGNRASTSFRSEAKTASVEPSDWDKEHFEEFTKQVSDLGNCAKCGAKNKISQAGKPYCSALCWKK